MYHEMRELWLRGPSPVDTGSSTQHAVMMEFWIASTRVCLLAAADGAASVYFENGGGMIGGETVPAVAEAATAFVRQVSESRANFARTEEVPFALPSEVTFCIRTADGLFRAQAPEAALDHVAHPLGMSFSKGQEVITELRRHNQARIPLQVYLHSDGGLEITDAMNPEPVWCLLADLSLVLAVANKYGTKLQLHAAEAGCRAHATVLDVLNSGQDWERLGPPEPWPDGGTSLDLAIAGKRLDIASDLLERGADITTKDSNGYDAQLIANLAAANSLRAPPFSTANLRRKPFLVLPVECVTMCT